MSFLEKDLDKIKEGFWKEPINEAARAAFKNDKATIYGPMETQQDIDDLLKGKFASSIATREDGMSWFNQYYNNEGDNFYIVMSNQGDDVWIVKVTSQNRGSQKTWWNKDDQQVSPEQVAQIVATLGIPYDDTNESVLK